MMKIEFDYESTSSYNETYDRGEICGDYPKMHRNPLFLTQSLLRHLRRLKMDTVLTALRSLNL